MDANNTPLHNVAHVPFDKATDIPIDKAELLSTLLESLLYGKFSVNGKSYRTLDPEFRAQGFSLLMFGGTIWVLVTRRSTTQVNRMMLTAACALLLFSTAHLVIDVIRIAHGLILFRDTHPRGPIGYFSDASQWTFVSKSYVYTAQTLIGDGVILYRCYTVWQSKLVVILPTLLWCGVAATGIANPLKALKAGQGEVFGGCLWEWITSFYTSTFMANSLTTFLLAFRIWSVDRKITKLCGQQKSQLRSISRIIIDAGMIYSFTLLAALICFVNKSNSQYVILNMVTPIISITFYMVIIRVGLSHRPCQSDVYVPIRLLKHGR
ncbi:hypothetical protein JVU11DRAFT_11817 [Chiua virens]|nr:hypothetical protein JVU11DRAFT_11817 [Chiua virens]